MGRRRFLAALFGAVVVAFSLLQAPAVGQELGDQQEHLAVLEARIRKGENEAATYQAQLVDIAASIATERGNLEEIRANLASTNERANVSHARMDRYRAGLNARAREIYKRGGALETIGVVLGSSSMDDFVNRVAYANELADEDNALIAGVAGAHQRVERLQQHQQNLERDQADIVGLLERREVEAIDVFAKQQLVLAELAQARGEAIQIVRSLGGYVEPGALMSIRQVAGHGMPISYEQWGRAFLETLGAPVVRNNLVVMVAWQAAEGTQATWNPLATTMPADDATNFNDVGVKNFMSMEQGIDASIRTLVRPGLGYDAILDGLERGAPPAETAYAIQQSRWCHGCAEGGYVISIIPAVEQYYDAYGGR